LHKKLIKSKQTQQHYEKMKAKTLLIAAAALAAGVMTSQAQVYSQNIVGYINIPLTPGYNLVANQLDVDGTGTNNGIFTTIGTNLPTGTKVLSWNGSGYSSATYAASTQKWIGNSSVISNSMNPGAGFFIDVGVVTNVTFVGNVITGTNTYPIVTGYQVVAPSGPVAGTIDTTNGYHPSKGDKILVWNGSGYSGKTYSGTTWIGGDPQLTVGQSVFLQAVNNTNWTEVLNVQ
jgi:hypothetical protein